MGESNGKIPLTLAQDAAYQSHTSHLTIISYCIISYHIISYHIISYHIISYHIISYRIV